MKKYASDKADYEMSSLEKVKALDKKVTDKATVISLCIGIIGALIMGFAMSLIMTDIGDFLKIENVLLIGIAIGIVGISGVISAYPLYQKILSSERKKIAPEIIIRLTDELSLSQ